MSETLLREAARELACEFAVAAVEQKHGRVRAEPEHVQEIVRLLRVEPDLGALGERRFDVKPGGAEIGAGHPVP